VRHLRIGARTERNGETRQNRAGKEKSSTRPHAYAPQATVQAVPRSTVPELLQRFHAAWCERAEIARRPAQLRTSYGLFMATIAVPLGAIVAEMLPLQAATTARLFLAAELFANDPRRLSRLAINRQIRLDRRGEFLGRAAGGVEAQIRHFLFDVRFAADDRKRL
jgi:hypothetical protein